MFLESNIQIYIHYKSKALESLRANDFLFLGIFFICFDYPAQTGALNVHANFTGIQRWPDDLTCPFLYCIVVSCLPNLKREESAVTGDLLKWQPLKNIILQIK